MNPETAQILAAIPLECAQSVEILDAESQVIATGKAERFETARFLFFPDNFAFLYTPNDSSKFVRSKQYPPLPIRVYTKCQTHFHFIVE
jgi:hypothetical protein